MAASEFSRLYRKVLGRALGPLGFQRKGSVFCRERNEVLHLIALHGGSQDFTVDVAVQALVFPTDAFVVTLGARLHCFLPGIPAWWDIPSARPEMEQVLDEFTQKVVEVAVPWLDRFQSTRDIVEIDRRRGRRGWGVGPMEWSSRAEKVGLCALDAGMYGRARTLLRPLYPRSQRTLEKEYRKLGMEVPEWILERQQMIRGLLDLVKKGEHEEIRRRLEEYKDYTRTALGIGEPPDAEAAPGTESE